MNKEIEKQALTQLARYCLKEISVVWVCKIESVIGKRYVFFCGECQKNLGISHEKEFASRVASTSAKNPLPVIEIIHSR